MVTSWLYPSPGFAQFGLFFSCHSTPGPGGAKHCSIAPPHCAWVVATGLISAAVVLFVGGAALLLAALVKCRCAGRRPPPAPSSRQSLVSWGKWIAFVGSELEFGLEGVNLINLIKT